VLFFFIYEETWAVMRSDVVRKDKLIIYNTEECTEIVMAVPSHQPSVCDRLSI
jgi:hypothetical protein